MQCMLNKEQQTPAGGVIPRALAPPGSPVPGARVLLLPEAGDRPPVFTFSLLGSSLMTDACFPKQRATRFAAFLMHYRLMNGGCKTSSFELFPLPDVLLTRRTTTQTERPAVAGAVAPRVGERSPDTALSPGRGPGKNFGLSLTTAKSVASKPRGF